MIIKPHHQGIAVTDLERSIRWYEEMLGFEPLSRKFLEQLNMELAFLRLGDFQIELLCRRDIRPEVPENRRHPDEDVKTGGTKHVAYEVSDLSSFAETLRQKGVRIIKEPFSIGKSRACFIADPDGVLIELIQPGM